MSNISLVVNTLRDKGHCDAYQLLYWYNQQSTTTLAELECLMARLIADGVVGSYTDRGCEVYYLGALSAGW